jgi:hypothetical protein
MTPSLALWGVRVPEAGRVLAGLVWPGEVGAVGGDGGEGPSAAPVKPAREPAGLRRFWAAVRDQSTAAH